ncbi:unnamed protein product, partial [Chrysoparadoxa australica]
FTLPLLVIWLSNPIMSLVDTAVVGMKSSAELAALGPATAVCDNITYVFTFLASVTTALSAAAIGKGDKVAEYRSITSGLTLAAIMGLGLTAFLWQYGPVLLKIFFGGSKMKMLELMPYSLSYVRIRAIGMVAVCMQIVCQGACMAQKNTITPLQVCAVSAGVNVVLDVFMVMGMGMGISGAALATMLAQVAGSVILVKRVLAPIPRRYLKLPKAPCVKEFLRLGIPTALAVFGQCLTTFMVTVAASSCSAVSLAAHQVVYSLFILFCPIGEALCQTAQVLGSWVAGWLGIKSKKPRLTFSQPAVHLLKMIGFTAVVLGAVDAFLAYLIPNAVPFIFTPDAAVWRSMRSISPHVGLVLATHALSMLMQ